MEDYAGSQAQGSVLFSDSLDWEVHAGPVDPHPDMQALIAKIHTNNPSDMLGAARSLSILSSEGFGESLDVHGCRTEIVAAGGHDALLKFVAAEATEDTTLMLAREAATAAIANLCAQDDSRALVASAGGIPILVALITGWSRGQNLSEELMTYACGALGNLARENFVCQDEIAAAGGIKALVALARAAGIKPDGASPPPPDHKESDKKEDEEEEDTGLELNASIALRKLAINHPANYAAMKEELDETDLRYFLHGELPSS